MYISKIKIKIKNFTNFSDFEVSTGQNIVIVGENKVGKSNLLFAMRLILDPSLSERDRMLTLDHFWDGLGDNKLGSTIEISLEVTGFEGNPALAAHLGDCIISAGPPMVSKLTYRFQPKEDLEGDPASLSDYEYIIFGGDNPDNSIPSSLRRMLPLDVMEALRDAEKNLASWNRSPLRPLIQEMVENLDDEEREEIENTVNSAQEEISGNDDVKSCSDVISQRLAEIVGNQHATEISLGLAPVRADALLRALRILIDGGARGISEASLGTANLIFLTLKSLELDRLVQEGERNHTFMAVEEPEAHLHPHVQRLVYRYFLDGSYGRGQADVRPKRLTTILTTHSPHIASVAPLRSVVLLRHASDAGMTVGSSTALTSMDPSDIADLQRYVDVTRGEIFFARGVILVEGDAERFLIPAFAETLGIQLDVLGISVCSVSGTNFLPYIKLLGKQGLNIPYVVLTDRDPVAGKNSRAVRRLQKLLNTIDVDYNYDGLNENSMLHYGSEYGLFVNDSTLEVDLFKGGLEEEMQEIILSELNLGQSSKDKLQEWVDDPADLDDGKFLKLVDRVSKGRLAQKLAPLVTEDDCPEYIKSALERIRDAVS